MIENLLDKLSKQLESVNKLSEDSLSHAMNQTNPEVNKSLKTEINDLNGFQKACQDILKEAHEGKIPNIEQVINHLKSFQNASSDSNNS